MDFHSFPMDKHLCPMTLSSYFFTESDLYYELGEVTIYKGVKENNQFDILGVESTRSSLIFSSGVYSSLNVDFKFRRRIQTFMLGFYIPSILTVMLSWVSFYISPSSAPARCALGIITVLAIGGFLTGQRSSFPVVSYVMAADLFILVCYVFTFLALVEYAAVHYFFVYEKQLYQMNKIMKNNSKTRSNFIIDEGEYEPDDDEDEAMRTAKLPEPVTFVIPNNSKVVPFPTVSDDKPVRKRGVCKYVRAILTSPCKLHKIVKNDAISIDKFSRVAFPLSFGVFNALYWSVYSIEYNSDSI
ncbi:hypothetical protein QZH41_002117 [Actinostola sp. cb2023]|nr:hypothetical protein QZH41_002117 [Actinostola sp. cb2023]